MEVEGAGGAGTPRRLRATLTPLKLISVSPDPPTAPHPSGG